MRNYIRYYAGKVQLVDLSVDPPTVNYSEFIACEDKATFDLRAQYIFDLHHQFFTWTSMRKIAGVRYFRMDKESVVWVLNGCTRNTDPEGASLPAPAYFGQFDRENTDLLPLLTKFFVDKSPRKLKKPV